MIASECCSCMTMRGENHKNTSEIRPVPSQFNGDCLSEQVRETAFVCQLSEYSSPPSLIIYRDRLGTYMRGQLEKIPFRRTGQSERCRAAMGGGQHDLDGESPLSLGRYAQLT
jgi:hypothetical protein